MITSGINNNWANRRRLPGFTSLKLTYANRDIIKRPVTAVIVTPATSEASPEKPS